MSYTLIIGYGNPSRGDDALGYYAAQSLSELVKDEKIKIITCHQLTPELAAEVARFEKVIFIDASIGEQPGILRVTKIAHTQTAKSIFSHQLDPESILACSQALYGQVPEAYLVTITANSFEYIEDLSVAVRNRLPELTDAIYQLIGFEPAVQKINHQKLLNKYHN